MNKIWSSSQSKLPKNIYNPTIRYINNNLPKKRNLRKWGISSNSNCSFCLSPESLLHIVAGCQYYLERFTWRHDSILLFLAKTFQTLHRCKLFVDFPGLISPSVKTGDEYRPDVLVITPDEDLYMLELTVGYESNLARNTSRKKAKYSIKIKLKTLDKNFKSVKFVNLSISSLGVFHHECHTFLEMLDDVGLDKQFQKCCIRKLACIAIRSTYYVFCCRNKEWSNPELMNIYRVSQKKCPPLNFRGYLFKREPQL